MLLEPCDRSFAAAVRCPLDLIGVRNALCRESRLPDDDYIGRQLDSASIFVIDLSLFLYSRLRDRKLATCASINSPPARLGEGDKREIKVAFNNKKSALLAGFWLVCLGLAAAQAQDDGGGSLMLVNGRIHTLDADNTVVSSVLHHGGRIVA